MPTLSPLRRAALAILRLYVPSTYGDPRFTDMINGSWAPGYGTTCGYLVSLLLWLLGCRDPRVVNREVPADGLHYHAGANMSQPVNGAKAVGAYRTTGTPKPGDPYFVFVDPPVITASGAKDYRNHMGIVVGVSNDGATWHTADAGQGSSLEQSAAYRERSYRASPSPMLSINGEWRHVHFIDLDALPMGTPPRPWPVDAGTGANSDVATGIAGLGALILAAIAGWWVWRA